MKRWTSLLVLLVVLSLVLSACSVPAFSTPMAAQPTGAPTSTEVTPSMASQTDSSVVRAPNGLEAVAALEGTLSEIYERVNPSVVHVRVVKRTPMAPFFGQPPEVAGTGSGFVWNDEGYIVTNNHVVEGAESVRVTFTDGHTVPAKVVGTDPDSDLAVLKVDVPADELHPVQVADSTKLKVGELAIAIGNPFALSGTMTVGIISALGRVLPTESEAQMGAHYVIPDVIQTDAAINPGNSGGPLLNSKGQVIGVTSAIISPVRASVGIGFAIPSVIVNKVVPKLIKQGYYEHPWLGISVVSLTPEIAKAMHLPEDQRGALVQQVIPNSPADKAGLRGSDRQVTIKVDGQEEQLTVGGDVIIAIDDHEVQSVDDLLTYLARYTEVGQKVTLTVLRDGKPTKVEVTLGARPSQRPQTARPGEGGEAHQAWLGIFGITVVPEIAKAMNLPEDQTGVLVQAVVQGSPADKAGLRGSYKPVRINGQDILVGGDIIVGFNGEPVTSMEDLLSYLSQASPGDKVTLTILRDGKKMTVDVVLGKRPKDVSNSFVLPNR